MKYFLLFIFALSLNAAPNIDPDVEIRINGLVCSSCAVGLKKVFKNKNVVGFDIVELAPNPHNKAPDFLVAKLYYKMLSYQFN